MKVTIGTWEHCCTEPVGQCVGEIISTVKSVTTVRLYVLRDPNTQKILYAADSRDKALAHADKHGVEVINR
jgi:hypothetical protein